MSYAYLVALSMVASRNHTGQWSLGYRLTCLAEYYAQRWHTGVDIWRTVCQLESHELYPQHSTFRKHVAFWLKRLRHYRSKM